MAPRTRAGAAKRPKQVRQLTQFGELDTTTTSRDRQSPQKNDEHRTRSQTDEFDNDLDDIDLVKLDQSLFDNPERPKSLNFSWSEAGSLTRRSSPLRAGDTPSSIWQFGAGDSLAPFSSPNPDRDTLPDTLPLPTQSMLERKAKTEPELKRNQVCEAPADKHQRVDFSETASTLRRSSPFGVDDSLMPPWDLSPSAQSNPSAVGLPTVYAANELLPDTLRTSQVSTPAFLQGDDIDDATPPPFKPSQGASLETGHSLTPSKLQSLQLPNSISPDTLPEQMILGCRIYSLQEMPADLLSDEELVPSPPSVRPIKTTRSEHQESNTGTNQDTPVVAHENLSSQPSSLDLPDAAPDLTVNMGSKRSKQRAKTPLEFDDTTQQIKFPPTKKAKAAPSRMPIVTALRDSVQPSSSPAKATRKRAAAKRAPPRKKAKTAATERPKATQAETKPAVASTHEKFLASSKPSRPSTKGEVGAEQNSSAPLRLKKQDRACKPGKEKSNLIVLSSDCEDSLYFPDLEVSPPGLSTLPLAENAQDADQDDDVARDVRTDSASPLKLERGAPEQARRDVTSNNTHCNNPPGATRAEIDYTSVTAAGSVQRLVGEKMAVVQGTSTQKLGKASNAQLLKADPIHERTPLAPRDGNVTKIPQESLPSKIAGSLVVDRHTAQQHERATLKNTKPDVVDRALGRPTAAPDNQNAPSKHTNRNFSISEQGSPVPAQSQIIVEKSPIFKKSTRPKFVLSTETRKHRDAPVPARKNSPLALPEEGLISTAMAGMKRLQDGYNGVRKLSSGQYKGDNAASANRVTAFYSPPQSERPTTNPTSNTDSMHAQMMVSLADRGQERRGSSGDQAPTKHSRGHQFSDGVRQGRTAAKSPTQDVAQQMHDVVEVVLAKLAAKEEGVGKIARVYRTRGIESVDKIQKHFVQERDEVVQSCLQDEMQFSNKIQRAAKAIEEGRLKRSEVAAKLEETMAKRRHVYARASTSLRAIHRELLDKAASPESRQDV